jgi:H+/gluconate symporter-like permease
MIGVIGIILSLALLMYLAYRGINVLFLAPICATIAVLFGGLDAPVLGTYTQVFMIELGKYLAKFFPLFMLGAIFGKLMDDSGSARVIAETIASKVGADRALLAIVLACGILTYGGVSLFVVAFAVYPIGAALLRASDTPKRLLPGAIALGSFTFTMTALPYTPAIQNAIPSPFFGTTTGAAPGLGIIGGLLELVGGMLWLNWRAASARKRGEGYGQHDEPALAATALEHRPPFAIALAPIIIVIVLNYIFSNYVLPAMDTSYLAQPKYGATKVSSVLGVWAIIAALIVACVACVALNWSRFADVADSINKGTFGSMLPIFNTASEVGYGNVIASLPAFVIVREAMTHLTNNPVLLTFISVSSLAGITGSASGGLSIALSAIGEQLVAMAKASGISLELLHRVAAMACGSFDTLPHNGAVITLLSICGLNHRQSFLDIFIVSSVITAAATLTVILLGATFGTF